MESKLNINQNNILTNEDCMKMIVQNTLSSYYFTLPVQVMAVDQDNLTVDVKPLLLGSTINGEKVDTNIIYNVNYIRIQSGESAIIIDPTVGDNGIIFVATLLHKYITL